MDPTKGYVYVRENETTKMHNAVKIGKTTHVVNRGSQYHTYEICPGKFIKVIEVPLKQLDTIEKMIKQYFSRLNVNKGAGTEYFKKEILDQIIPYISGMSLLYRDLSPEEVKQLERKIYVKEIQLAGFSFRSEKIKQIKMPRQDQFEIIEKVIAHFSIESKGFLILPCGVGKTLISLWIIQRMKWSKILVGVPNCNLLVQWQKTFEEMEYFKGFEKVLIQQGVSETEISNIAIKKRVIVITTYQSCNKLVSQKFDAKICDEMHHLTSKDISHSLQEERKTNLKFLLIDAHFQLGLTATPRVIQERGKEELNPHSRAIANDTTESFGEAIVERGLRSAIDLNTICDYRINIYASNASHLKIFDELEVYDDRNRRLVLTAYGILHLISTGKCSNWLVCANTIEGCGLLKSYVKDLLPSFSFLPKDVFVDVFTSELPQEQQKSILQTFESCEKGILINVQCLAEGYSFTGLHGVAIAEPIHSKIRATQFLTRNLRLHPSEPDKIGTMFIPHIEPDEDGDYEAKKREAFKAINEVINSLGETDEAIYGRLTVTSAIELTEKEINKGGGGGKEHGEVVGTNLELTEDYINNIKKFRLKEYTSLGLITYSKMKAKLKEKHLTSVPDYFKICEKDFQFPTNPREIFQEKFKSWMDYLSIDEDRFYTLGECRREVNKGMRRHPEIKQLKLENKLAEILECVSQTDARIPSTVELVNDLYKITTLNEFFKT
jgi:superfamily II DNA or RNA helicase